MEDVAGARLADVAMRIMLDDEIFVQRTDGRGVCALQIPDAVGLPGHVVASVVHGDFMPEAVTFPGRASAESHRTVRCRRITTHVYARDDGLHHLGNDHYDGAANSQHQLSTEGIERQYRFHLDTYPIRMPMLRFYARGVEHPTEVRVNGQLLGTLANSAPDGDLSRYEFRLPGDPTAILRPGSNTLSIRTAPFNQHDPWDDIEFCSLLLYFQ